MLEYIVVLCVVGAAAFYAGRNLWREAQGKGCEECSCPEKKRSASKLIQID